MGVCIGWYFWKGCKPITPRTADRLAGTLGAVTAEM